MRVLLFLPTLLLLLLLLLKAMTKVFSLVAILVQLCANGDRGHDLVYDPIERERKETPHSVEQRTTRLPFTQPTLLSVASLTPALLLWHAAGT